MNPQLIMGNVQETYRGFESYSDVGTVDVVPAVGKTSTEFKTYFVKPSKMRFEWRDWHPYFGKEKPANENAIWSDGESSHQLVLGQLAHAELSNALAMATGVSACSVFDDFEIAIARVH